MWFITFTLTLLVFCSSVKSDEKLFLPPVQGVWGTLPPGAQIAQNGLPVTPGGSRAAGFICVAPGTCNCNGCSSGDIDIRIVTPANKQRQAKVTNATRGKKPRRRINNVQPRQSDLCPPGLIPCYGFQCGTRAVPTVEGDGYANNGSFPWQAYLENTTGFAGSGVLIDSYHVITAAHKVYDILCCPQNLIVTMGLYNPSDRTGTQSSPVAKIIIHENYIPASLTHDIAILRLANPIVFGAPNIGVICMPTQGQSVNPGTACMVSGWGQTTFQVNDAPTNPQKQVTVPIISLQDCRAVLSTVITNVDFYLNANDVCAGTQSMRDACTQDGGSPLVCLDPATNTQFVFGLVIWGKGCGTQGVPGVYVGVPNYVNWINTNIYASK